MAENPNVGSRKKTMLKEMIWRSRSCNELDDVNMSDISESPRKASGEQKHDATKGRVRKLRHFFSTGKSHKENYDRHNTPTGNDRSTTTADKTVKGLNTEMEHRLRTGTESHSNVPTKSSPVSAKPERYNQGQEERTLTETLCSMDTYSATSLTHRLNEDLHPGLEEKCPGGYDRCTCTSDAEAQMKELLAGFNDTELRRITGFYRQRLEGAIEGFADRVGLELLNKDVIDGREYQHVNELMKRKQRTEASKFLFDKVMEIGAKAGRAMWEIFVNMHGTMPKLREILQEMQAKGYNLRYEATWSEIPSKVPHYLEEIQNKHKENLIQQCDKMKVKSGERTNVHSLEDRYTEVIIVKRPLKRRTVENELWAIGRKHEKWQKRHLTNSLEKVGIDQLFRSSFGRTSLSGTSVVTGVAGIGKTSMVQKIVHDWAAGKIYQQFNFVFLFKFRDLRDLKKTSLKQLVLDSYRYFGKNLEHVWEEPAKILLIFDGLDEFHENIDFSDQQRNEAPEHRCFDPECQCEVSDIVRCLMQGKLLKGCSVLITSRPSALESLDKSDVNLWAEILGFLAEERRDYCRRFFGYDKIADEVFKYIEENDVLYTLCYIPVYCWIICSTLAPLFRGEEKRGRQLPETITELFSNFLASLLKREGCNIENRRELLVKLAEMAYEGVSKRSLIFHDDDFHRHDLKPSTFTSGFMMQILPENNSARSAVHTFTHLTLQEFLAALSLFLKSTPQKMEQVLNKATWNSDSRFEIFFRFLAGLSSPYSTRELKKDLGSFDESTGRQVIDWLNEEVQRRIEKSEGQDKKTKLLAAFHQLYESRNSPLMNKLIGSVRKVEFSGLELSPVDCTVLATVLRPCEILEEMDLTQCSIQDEGIQRLTGVLHKCKILRLNQNKLEDMGVKRLSTVLKKNDCKIQILDLQANNLTNGCIEELASAIIANQSVTELDLSNHTQGGKYSNDLTDSSIPALYRLIQMNHHLREIRLRHNGFTARGHKSLESDQGTKTRCNFD